jgi:hypothetical protein
MYHLCEHSDTIIMLDLFLGKRLIWVAENSRHTYAITLCRSFLM